MKTQDKMHHISTFIVYQERKKTAPNVRLKKIWEKIAIHRLPAAFGIQKSDAQDAKHQKTILRLGEVFEKYFSLKNSRRPAVAASGRRGFLFFLRLLCFLLRRSLCRGSLLRLLLRLCGGFGLLRRFLRRQPPARRPRPPPPPRAGGHGLLYALQQVLRAVAQTARNGRSLLSHISGKRRASVRHRVARFIQRVSGVVQRPFSSTVSTPAFSAVPVTTSFTFAPASLSTPPAARAISSSTLPAGTSCGSAPAAAAAASAALFSSYFGPPSMGRKRRPPLRQGPASLLKIP